MRKKQGKIMFVFALLLVAIIALTQESEEDGIEFPPPQARREIPDWVTPARWFRSNSGGMALEEIPSRLAALRNEYALVIDFIESEELPGYLIPFYDDLYFIETRVLYKKGEASRTQYIFRDPSGTDRLVAAFYPAKDGEASSGDENNAALADTAVADAAVAEPPLAETAEAGLDEEGAAETETVEDSPRKKNPMPRGFIEIYGETRLITADYQFFEDGGEIKTEFFYNRGVMTSSETWQDDKKIYTDTFRYNRSQALRFVERLYHETQNAQAEADGEFFSEPVRLMFPSRVLDAAKDDHFIGDKLMPASGFLGDTPALEGYRMAYTVDERGRILTQTLFDGEDKEVWVIVNTWQGERVISMLKTEGDDKLLTEYEYDDADKRVLERNSRNGTLERLVRTEADGRETEELYMNDVVILRAVWEDGRKISEQRIRNR